MMLNGETLKTESSRMHWIDAMRGFTMFLVVFYHFQQFGLGMLNPLETVLGNVFVSFRMPAFFFISGFVAYKSIDFWTGGNWFKRLRTKARVELTPTVVFFLLLTLCQGKSLSLFFAKGFNLYWFTFVLFEIFCVYFTASLLYNKLKLRYFTAGMLMLAVVSLAINLLLKGSNQSIVEILALRKMTGFLPFFLLGVVCKRHSDKFFKCLNNDWLITIATVVFIASLFIVYYAYFGVYQMHPVVQVLRNYVVKFSGLFTVVALFYNKRHFFEGDSKLKKIMCFVGKRTLDIYMLHFFLISDMNCIYPGALRGNIVYELVICTAFSIVIVAVSLGISGFIRNSKMLTYLLFGGKK